MDLASSAIRVEKESVWLNWVVAKKRLGWLEARHVMVALILTGIRTTSAKRRRQRRVHQSWGLVRGGTPPPYCFWMCGF